MSKDALSQQELLPRFEQFLRKRLPAAEKIVVTGWEPVGGGYSRVMTRITVTIDGEESRFVARSDPPAGQAVIETDRVKEWNLLAALTERRDVPVPAAVFADVDGSELGSPTIVLECVEGETLLARVLRADETERQEWADALADLAVELHSIDLEGLPETEGRPESWGSYLEACIAQWRAAEAAHAESDPFYRYVAAWLDENRPSAAPLSLVHGDYQTGNVLVEAGSERLVAVDWELAHVGDPREDLGWCKWVGSLQPPDLVGDATRFAARYCEHSGLDSDVVNPTTIGYFSILSAVKVFQGVVAAIDAFSAGLNTSVATAYMVGALTTGHEQWLAAALACEEAGRQTAEDSR